MFIIVACTRVNMWISLGPHNIRQRLHKLCLRPCPPLTLIKWLQNAHFFQRLHDVLASASGGYRVALHDDLFISVRLRNADLHEQFCQPVGGASQFETYLGHKKGSYSAW